MKDIFDWKPVRLSFLVLSVILGLLLLAGCGDPTLSTTGNGNGVNEGDKSAAADLSSEALDDLIAFINSIDDPLTEVTQEGLDELRSDFTDALNLNPQDPLANLAMGLFAMVELAFDEDYRELLEFMQQMDSLQVGDDIPEVPTAFLTTGAIQTQADKVLDVIEAASGYVTTAMAGTDGLVVINIVDEQTHFGVPEMRLMHAAMSMMQASVSHLLMYDFQLYTADGVFEFDLAELVPNDGLPAMEAVHYSLSNETSFLTRRSGSAGLPEIRDMITAAISEASTGLQEISERTGDQSQYLVPNDNLDLESDQFENLLSMFGALNLDPGKNIVGLGQMLIDILNGDQVIEIDIAEEDEAAEIVAFDISRIYDYSGDLRALLPDESYWGQNLDSEMTDPEDIQERMDYLMLGLADAENYPEDTLIRNLLEEYAEVDWFAVLMTFAMPVFMDMEEEMVY